MIRTFTRHTKQLICLISLSYCCASAATEWQVVAVDKQMQINDEHGQSQTIHPACALDYVSSPLDGSPLDNSFHFYVKPGKSKDVLVFFNGGGACWNDATCVASLGLAQVPGARPSYNPSILQANSPQQAGGIFDDSNPENPTKDWTKVFIPYCTGDIHIGSKDVTYTDQDGSVTGFPGAPMTIKHRGFDNFMAVREWMKNNLRKPAKLLVAGSSAGAYGATLNFAHLQSAFPRSRLYLLSDGGASVVTQGFIDSVFDFDGNWNVEHTLPQQFADHLGTYSAFDFNARTMLSLAYRYPLARFAQYTTEQDAVQVQFLKIMDQIDAGNTNPYTWGLSEADYLYFIEWNLRMKLSFGLISTTSFNYQYYIGKGMVHTVLTDAFATADMPHPFYMEQSAQDVKFTDWLDRFIDSRWFREQSVAYQP